MSAIASYHKNREQAASLRAMASLMTDPTIAEQLRLQAVGYDEDARGDYQDARIECDQDEDGEEEVAE